MPDNCFVGHVFARFCSFFRFLVKYSALAALKFSHAFLHKQFVAHENFPVSLGEFPAAVLQGVIPLLVLSSLILSFILFAVLKQTLAICCLSSSDP